MRLAIFDIDGTLVGGSSERWFWRYLWRHERLRPRQLAAFAWFFVRYGPATGRDVAKKNKAYLAGLELAEIERLAIDFAASRLRERLLEPVVARLREHQQRGDTVLLLSGTLQPIAKALADHLGVEHVCATLCSEDDRRASARPPERHPYGPAKLILARAFAHEHGLDLKTASAYCDSHNDLDLLEQVGYPIAVMPDRRLREIALRRKWEILAGEPGAHSAAVRSLRLL